MKPAFMFVDIETTGLDVFHDQITEIAIITRTSAFDKASDTEYKWFLKHDRLPNDWVLNNTDYFARIVPAVKADPMEVCIMICDIISALKYGGERKVYAVGAAVQFDDRFLRHLWRKTFEKISVPTMEPPWNYHLIDIETIVAGVAGYTVPMHLAGIREVLNMDGSNLAPHTALGDAREVRDMWDEIWARRTKYAMGNICNIDRVDAMVTRPGTCGKVGCMYCDS